LTKLINIGLTNVQEKVKRRKTTAGWDLEVEWRDGTKLNKLKETNIVEVSHYAVEHQIETDPAFDWWLRHLLKKQKRLIKKASTSRHRRHGYIFSI
jgi:hypothetical protein